MNKSFGSDVVQATGDAMYVHVLTDSGKEDEASSILPSTSLDSAEGRQENFIVKVREPLQAYSQYTRHSKRHGVFL